MDWMTTKEVAERLRIGRTTVYHWMKHHDLPRPLKMGGKRRWRRDEIEAWIESREAARHG